MLTLCLRLGDPQCVITTTPKPRELLVDLVKRAKSKLDVALTTGSTMDNVANLSERFVTEIITQFQGTRLERQEIYGELLEEFEGALWNHSVIDNGRVFDVPEKLRTVVAVDPATTANENSDLTGIVVAGLSENGHIYVLGDHSLRGSPRAWARKAIALYDQFSASVMVAEKNQGGDMVREVILSVDPAVNVRLVHASKGKITRAEPVAAMYEQGRIHHAGTLSALEDEMCIFLPGEILKKSPNRVDALVWACAELMPKIRRRGPRVRST